jgi:hypothetical protein
MGEYDPLCHLGDAVEFFEELRCPRELWVFEDEFHRISQREGIGGLEIYPFIADWLRDELDGRHPPDLNRTVLVPKKRGAGPYEAPVSSLSLPGRASLKKP